MQDQHADLEWRADVPISRQFDDPYFSLDDGLAETAHVFLSGNDLPARFDGPIEIGELGFGTGLNFLVTWAAWEAAGARHPLTFHSFEAFPMSLPDMAKALDAFPGLAEKAATLIGGLAENPAQVALTGGPTLRLDLGDARRTLPASTLRADAWYLDGFSPAKNPELWEPALMAEVARHTVPGGTAATYSAAGHVRRALQDAGFTVTRVPGYGRKRHMTQARMPA
ncbi:tRNA (5-methylaminomethyl-2-thiouridine)(34)-methyltransferase MnmD [Flavimaricola marinus]|uniref:tRNA 5-methylaminomethyl-2-thiouridine biosynthesis bifunctional protein MnmC n=1 Tax=Flavimaricola marinus TaxID=1819565 RepID=A0A238LG26_9RHOB|nr:tRNA (5-methylaminomethyl-2-thiouridine)(34)-methyltransferase MnmD [Flavimaricola marinus]SMY08374.1 tRNA 5-methylaminomethyl-2-thiouridine biosynthesis bifunctional protein MnmC [Flavimaricola marinus]